MGGAMTVVLGREVVDDVTDMSSVGFVAMDGLLAVDNLEAVDNAEAVDGIIVVEDNAMALTVELGREVADNTMAMTVDDLVTVDGEVVANDAGTGGLLFARRAEREEKAH